MIRWATERLRSRLEWHRMIPGLRKALYKDLRNTLDQLRAQFDQLPK